MLNILLQIQVLYSWLTLKRSLSKDAGEDFDVLIKDTLIAIYVMLWTQ